jgi:hypothetical protein
MMSFDRQLILSRKQGKTQIPQISADGSFLCENPRNLRLNPPARKKTAQFE